MNSEVLAQAVASVRNVMPSDAEIETGMKDFDFFARCSWKLRDDPGRPNKPSRNIRVRFARAFVDDLADEPRENWPAAFQRVEAYLRARLANFDPAHNTPYGSEPPFETWVVPSSLIYR